MNAAGRCSVSLTSSGDSLQQMSREVNMPWRPTRMRSKSEDLGYIMQHAVCKHCGMGTRPQGFALVRMKYQGSRAPSIER